MVFLRAHDVDEDGLDGLELYKAILHGRKTDENSEKNLQLSDSGNLDDFDVIGKALIMCFHNVKPAKQLVKSALSRAEKVKLLE